MSEKTWEVRTLEIDYICDACGRGAMRHTDELVLLSKPPQYKHECANCGVNQTFDIIYPYQTTERL